MLRILGEISVYGSAASLERLVSTASIQNGVLKQIGTLRKVPDKDFWCYASPRYRFHADTLDEEVRGFLTAHKRLGEALAINDAGIRYALFTLCPVDQSYEEAFACLLGKDTLRVLSDLGLALEIAPESVMPEAEYWVKREASQRSEWEQVQPLLGSIADNRTTIGAMRVGYDLSDRSFPCWGQRTSLSGALAEILQLAPDEGWDAGSSYAIAGKEQYNRFSLWCIVERVNAIEKYRRLLTG